jgi:hypothetical protein
VLALAAALAKIGFIAAIGWWIDLALDDSQQKRVRRKLDDWWTKFDDTGWFSFGSEEGKAALRLFDMLLGDRFWAGRRWASVGVILAAVVLSIIVLIRGHFELLPVSRTPSLGVMMRPEGCNGKEEEDVQSRVQAGGDQAGP